MAALVSTSLNLSNALLAVTPLIPSIVLVFSIKDVSVVQQLAISIAIAIGGYLVTSSLIPVVAEFTLKRGLSGKDLGKKGSKLESKDVPEALGLVTGTVYLICAIASQLIFAKGFEQQMVYNSALFSVCFMIFLGFLDDTLDLKWRYKLVLPPIASLPLLSAYNGSTALYVPLKFQHILMNGKEHTLLGAMVNLFVVVDNQAAGAIVELGGFFLLFMGLLAVFCTNAINIYAGINGLECGQAFIIACSILFFKLYEIAILGQANDNQIFAVVMIVPLIGTMLGLLRFNWFPAQVFVGDTFCYFAGMTFAVIGIHGHFSKTLLLLFLPQVINFVYSIPQLFKVMPCPRHRLPRVDPATQLLHYSAFPCTADQFQWNKVTKESTECPNCTLICLVLRLTGPLHERTLCTVLLVIQIAASMLVFWLRYFFLVE